MRVCLRCRHLRFDLVQGPAQSRHRQCDFAAAASFLFVDSSPRRAVVGYGEESGKKYWILKNTVLDFYIHVFVADSSQCLLQWATAWGEKGYMSALSAIATRSALFCRRRIARGKNMCRLADPEMAAIPV